MNKSIWIFVVTLAMPAVAVLGQQNGSPNNVGSGRASQSSHEENHAMQTGSPNDNGAGLSGDYGNTPPDMKVKQKHRHSRRSKKYTHMSEPKRPGSRGTDTTRAIDTAHPQ